MKPGSIIHRYIFWELVSPFFISLVILLFLFLMTMLIDITDMVVNYRVSFVTVLTMLVYNIPFFLQYIIPMSIMIGVLLGFLKMSSDNEIIALKAGGMSVYAMLTPVIVFCMMGCLVTAFMSVFGQPWGSHSTRTLVQKLNTTSITALLKERSFNDRFDNRTIYITKLNPVQNALEGIFIEYQLAQGQSVTITAPRGRLVGDSGDQVYHLLLEQGQINRADIESESVSATSFDTCQIRLDLNRPLTASMGMKKTKEMTPGELREYLRSSKEKDEQYFKALTIFHAKFSIPFACFAMGILAVPLGVQSKSARRSFGIGLGVFFFLGYYLILSLGEVYGKTGHYPPVIGMWAPNIIMGGIGCFLLVQCARERAIDIGGLLTYFNRRPQHGSGSGGPHSFPPDP